MNKFVTSVALYIIAHPANPRKRVSKNSGTWSVLLKIFIVQDSLFLKVPDQAGGPHK